MLVKSAQGYNIVLPPIPDTARDPFLSPDLKKWLMLLHVVCHLHAGALPAILVPLSREFSLSVVLQGAFAGTVHAAQFIGALVAERLLRRFRVVQLLTLSAGVVCLTSLATASLSGGNRLSTSVGLFTLRALRGLAQAILLTHGSMWAKRTAPKGQSSLWKVFFCCEIVVISFE